MTSPAIASSLRDTLRATLIRGADFSHLRSSCVGDDVLWPVFLVAECDRLVALRLMRDGTTDAVLREIAQLPDPVQQTVIWLFKVPLHRAILSGIQTWTTPPDGVDVKELYPAHRQGLMTPAMYASAGRCIGSFRLLQLKEPWFTAVTVSVDPDRHFDDLISDRFDDDEGCWTTSLIRRSGNSRLPLFTNYRDACVQVFKTAVLGESHTALAVLIASLIV